MPRLRPVSYFPPEHPVALAELRRMRSMSPEQVAADWTASWRDWGGPARRPKSLVRRGPECLICGEVVGCGVQGRPNPLMAAHVEREHPWDIFIGLALVLEGGRYEC